MILGAFIALGVDVHELEMQLKNLIPEPFSLQWRSKFSFGINGCQLNVDIPLLHDDHYSDHFHNADSLSEKSRNVEPPSPLLPDLKTENSGFSNDLSQNHQEKHSHSESDEHRHSEIGEQHSVKHHSVKHHEHRSFADIRQMIESSSLDSAIKQNAIEIFHALAVAEAEVHQTEPDKVHFHEVGATDSIIDIVGAAIAYHQLKLDGISISPLPIGYGTVRCAHGIYPLPAPATATLIRNYQLPVSMDHEECEMLTPTGAAILAVWKKQSIPKGALLSKIAHSFGHYEMKSRPNLLRASLYETNDELSKETCENSLQYSLLKSTCKIEKNDAFNKMDQSCRDKLPEENKQTELVEQTELIRQAEFVKQKENSEQLSLFECNIDDVSGEILASAMNVLFEIGALDVWFTPIVMKKSRPAYLLSVLATPEKRDAVLTVLFQESGTFGIREQQILRHSLCRRWENIETKFGTIRVKIGSRFGNDLQFSPEYEDCLAASKRSNVPVLLIMQTVFAELNRPHSVKTD